MEKFLTENKKFIIEIVVVILFLVGMFYFYKVFNDASTTITKTQASEELLGQNLTGFLKVITQGSVSFDNTFLASQFFANTQDFSEDIPVTETRGRADPFVPYASSRPLR